MIKVKTNYDVLIAGGGNAALCAAMVAAENGARVLILERAPVWFRGGNSRHTRNIRYAHDSKNHYNTDKYTIEEFYNDLMGVTGGNTNEKLAKLCIERSNNIVEWMKQRLAKFQPAMEGTLHLERTNAFFAGGGKALINNYYHYCEKLGVDICYDAYVRDVIIKNGRFISLIVEYRYDYFEITANAVVIASGGFQSNLEWLREYWENKADNFIIRGTQFNEGNLLKILLDNGAKSVGDPKQCHAIAVDGRAPKYDAGIVTRLDCIPVGIVVNKKGERFYDEGEDIWPKRYAIWGHLIAEQPDQIAFAIIDSKVKDLIMPSVFPPYKSNSINDLAEQMGLNSNELEKTISKFNASIKNGVFDLTKLDNCATEGLFPPKSHWALPLNDPPYYGYVLKPGITFTYMGVSINKNGQVIDNMNNPYENIYAAGEIMSGNILTKGYMAGFGMTIGTVFGIIAGEGAANAK